VGGDPGESGRKIRTLGEKPQNPEGGQIPESRFGTEKAS